MAGRGRRTRGNRRTTGIGTRGVQGQVTRTALAEGSRTRYGPVQSDTEIAGASGCIDGTTRRSKGDTAVRIERNRRGARSPPSVTKGTTIKGEVIRGEAIGRRTKTGIRIQCEGTSGNHYVPDEG